MAKLGTGNNSVVIPDSIRNPGVVPAKAGNEGPDWIPACAGMTPILVSIPINGISPAKQDKCVTKLFPAGKAQKTISNLLIAGLFCFLVGGCGYRLYPASGKIGTEIQKVYVAVFTNNTPEANIETDFRNAFIDQFIKGRRFKVVDSEGSADAVLRGDIRNMILAPLSYRGDSNIAVEKRITVTLSLTLEAKGASAPLWREANFSQWGDFTLDNTNLLAGLASQKRAMAKLADDVAAKAYRRMIADF